MSAIFGIFYLDGRLVDRGDLQRMAESLAYRGPDKQEIWAEGCLGFGQCMFWTTPESLLEQLPLVRRSRQLAITADARIDNREELLTAFEAEEKPSSNTPDSEYILAAYQKWNNACPEKIIGDFAFTIWDGEKNCLFCARDPMGLKPLYYYYSPGHLFTFASDVKSLLCLSEVPRRLNELRVADHLAYLDDDRSITFFEDIYQLPSAHALIVSPNGLRIFRYWDLDQNQELRLPSDKDYAEAFLDTFTKAVECRVRSAFPVGANLSGGLDSSSIVAVARNLVCQNGTGSLHTFSAIFPSLASNFPEIDERPWIKSVITQGNVQEHFVEADQSGVLEALTFNHDEPVSLPNLWLDWGCFRTAHQSGVRVVLGGHDGDTAISYGYGLLAELARSLRIISLYREATAQARQIKWPLIKILKEDVLKELTPPFARYAWIQLRQHPSPPLFQFNPPINRSFAVRVGLTERARKLKGPPFEKFVSARHLHRKAILSGLMAYGVELIDKIAAAKSVEARLPFFDRRLLEFTVSLPTDQKQHLGWDRFIMRQALKNLLPEKIILRRNKGKLGSNARYGFKQEQNQLEVILIEKSKYFDEYIDRAAILTAYHRFITEPYKSSEADLFTILVSYTLIEWLLKTGFS